MIGRRRVRGVSAKLAAHLQAVEPGQHEVEESHVGPFRAGQPERGAAIGRMDEPHPRLLDVVADEVGDVTLVLHQKHRHRHG